MNTDNKKFNIFNNLDYLLPELSNQVRKNYMLICNVLHEYF